jgi:hypothetical protein
MNLFPAKTSTSGRYLQMPMAHCLLQQSVSVSQSWPVCLAVEQIPLGSLAAANTWWAERVSTDGAT